MSSAQEFLRQRLVDGSCYDIKTVVNEILDDMKAGLAGKKSSMFMLPTFLSCGGAPKEGKRVIVIDAGGTNLRVALVSIENGKTREESFKKYPMPGTSGTITKDRFFDEIAEKVELLCGESDVISFCFSYVAKPLPDHDGLVESLCKEVSVDGITGSRVCAELVKALRRRGVTKEFRCIHLNDSVAGLLGGISMIDDDTRYDGHAGVILGTGFNICYEEETHNIKTISGYPHKSMIINTEAGCYSGFERGETDDALNDASAIPGDHLAEKMISGAYLGEIMARALREAKAAGLISANTNDSKQVNLKDADDFLDGSGEFFESVADIDREFVADIIKGVYSRAARLSACLLTACGVRIKGGKASARIAALADGSTLLKSAYLMNAFKNECAAVGGAFGVDVEVVPSSGATLRGAACAALIN